MAIPWLIALKSIPWGTVIKHGPEVFDKARDMVNRRRDAREAAPDDIATQTDADRPPTVEELTQQIGQIQCTLADLSASHKALTQSVSELTQQHRQLAVSVKSLRRRVAFLVAGLVAVMLALGWTVWLA